MPTYLFELGNHKELSQAEIESLLDGTVKTIHGSFLILESDEKIDCTALMTRLGGTKKIAEKITESPTQFLLQAQREGKIQFSFSGPNAKRKGLSIKKELKSQGRSVRFIEANNTATILHNNLVEKQGDLTQVGNDIFVTQAIQPIEALSKRDYGRPGRDDKSGMLPPKLAQMLINLTGATTDQTLLDPYCGSGTILTEALLMGFTHLIGTDISKRAVEDTKKNVEWAATTFGAAVDDVRVEQIDVTEIDQQLNAMVDAICFEPYMGKGLHGNERKETIEKSVQELESLYVGAFTAFKHVLKLGGVIVGIIPQFRYNDEWITIDCLEKIKETGFEPIPLLEHTPSVLYFRDGQHVGRRIWKFRLLS